MKELENKLILFLLCVSLVGIPTDTIQITACCLTIGLSCLITYSDLWQIHTGILIIYSFLAICHPVFALFLPVFVYDVAKTSKSSSLPDSRYTTRNVKRFMNWGILLLAALLSIPPNPSRIMINLLLFSALAFLMQHYTQQIDTLLITYHNYQDESSQSKRYLKQKNEALILQQDYEISLAMAAERNRIARDIHDNVGHMLTRSILQTGALQVINQNPDLMEPIQELHHTLNTAMTSIRKSVHDLHQDTVDLKHTVEEIIHSIPDLDIRLDYHIDSVLPQKIQYTFIAVIQEALQNVTRHSNADQVVIRLREHPAMFQLMIQDNGTQIGEIHSTGIGLASMQERVESLHGNIHFSTEQGFQIFISVIK